MSEDYYAQKELERKEFEAYINKIAENNPRDNSRGFTQKSYKQSVDKLFKYLLKINPDALYEEINLLDCKKMLEVS